jgi:NAD(P)-dependent dehydrogenase (short-subunit alcohol dehydrogenase family)
MAALDTDRLAAILNKDDKSQAAFGRVVAVAQAVGDFETDIMVTDKDDPKIQAVYRVSVKRLAHAVHMHPKKMDLTPRPGDPTTMAELRQFLIDQTRAKQSGLTDAQVEELADHVIATVGDESRIPELMSGWHYAEDKDREENNG